MGASVRAYFVSEETLNTAVVITEISLVPAFLLSGRVLV
jgi:hypothetical protein